MTPARFLLDVNVLIALVEPEHVHYEKVRAWFETSIQDWGVCSFTEAGFLRIATNPKARGYSMDAATLLLEEICKRPGYRFWPIETNWMELTAPFRRRIFGHQQITDACLLGLAIRKNGVLVTLDKAMRYLAGERYARHVLVLE